MALQKGEALYCNKAWNSDGMWKDLFMNIMNTRWPESQVTAWSSVHCCTLQASLLLIEIRKKRFKLDLPYSIRKP